MKKKHIAIIGTVGLPARYGGFETLADHIVQELGSMYKFTVYCSSKKYAKSEQLKEYKGAKLVYLPINANGIGSILYDCISILHALFYADALLILGVPGGILFPFIRKFTRKKMIISIDGIEWKREKWNRPAKWYLWWAEKMAVKYAHADIADNESIQDYTAFRYGTLSNIIEYGADHTLKISASLAIGEEKNYPFLGGRYAFSVCRIEPENNVHLVLSAFASYAPYPLVFVGNWQQSEYARTLKQQYADHAGIYLIDPIYDQQQLDLLRSNAYVYIHGHSAGGTNPSLVEAMYLELPVIAFDVSYNRTTTEQKAIYFKSAEQLSILVNQLSAQQLQMNAKNMKEIAQRRYTWRTIAMKYQYLFTKVFAIDKKAAVRSSVSELPLHDLMLLESGHLAHSSLFYEKR